MNIRQLFFLVAGLALIVTGIWIKVSWVIYAISLPALLVFIVDKKNEKFKSVASNYSFLFLIIGCAGMCAAGLTYMVHARGQNPIELFKFGVLFLVPGILIRVALKFLSRRKNGYL